MAEYDGKKGEDILERARRCFKLAQDAEADQRKREIDDLRFQVPEYQWDEGARKQRQGDGDLIPARPILSISKLDQPLQLVLNQARAARLGVNIHPVSEGADKEGAEIRQGLYRRIERDSNADMARLWALDRASKAGRGVYRVNTKWDEDADPNTFDQEIVIERILHQESVYFDPSAKEPDYSDGEWAFECEWMSLREFKRRYPKSRTAKTGQPDGLEWEDLAQEAPNWVRLDNDGDDRAVLVSGYWYKEHDFQEVSVKVGKQTLTRERDVVTVFRSVITGSEVLKTEEWPGKYIPLIPAIGRELQPFNSERRYVGMIGPVKDAQRLYNYAASAAVEMAALEPKAPWMIGEGQDEGYEDEYKRSNTRNLPALHYKPVSLGGQPLPPPQRVQVDVSRLGPSMQLLQMGDQFIQSTSSVYDPGLGRESGRERSGKAIVALQQQGDSATSHYVASLADISMRLEARIVLDLMPKIYDRPGRVTTILRGDSGDTDPGEQIMLNAPYVKDQEGAPQRFDPNTMQGQTPLEYDLNTGAYSVSVTIGRSYQTRLQEGSDKMGEVLQARPELLDVTGDIYFGFQDWPGAVEIGKRLAKIIKQKFPGLIDEGDVPDAEQLQAQLQAASQENEQLKQQLQGASQALQTDQAKQEATVAKAQIDGQTKLTVAQIDAQSKGDVATLNAQVMLILAQMQQQTKAMEQQTQRIESALQRGHESNTHRAGMEHESGSAQAEREAKAELQAESLQFKASNDRAMATDDRY